MHSKWPLACLFLPFLATGAAADSAPDSSGIARGMQSAAAMEQAAHHEDGERHYGSSVKLIKQMFAKGQFQPWTYT